MHTGRASILLLAAGLACGRRPEAPARREAAAPVPQDSLVARAPGGVEVWFTLARSSTARDGTHCVDRTLEIRRGASRIPVPLLYTGTTPTMVNDSTIRATLSDRCHPGDAYLVNLRTGHPVRERP
ncbi:MAG TPA: hypothetical protein VHR41_17725 [Gemmatimonadales bacterium]|jgi:hypothetical protein|nr:hypothetical protein [Gemmatimonadales bacterium]